MIQNNLACIIALSFKLQVVDIRDILFRVFLSIAKTSSLFSTLEANLIVIPDTRESLSFPRNWTLH